MTAVVSNKAIALAVSLKGIAMAAVIVVIADAQFVQGLVIAIVSATITGCFLLYSIHLTSKRSEIGIEKKVDEAKTEIVQRVGDGEDG